MTIIRDQKDIAAASTADLVETYNAMTGTSIKKFENRAIGERRVAMALLSATDSAAHAGVPKGEHAAPKTVDELAAATYPAGSMRAKLQEEIAQQQPIAPRPRKADDTTAPKRQIITHVRATLTGTSRCQEGSIRAGVLAFIQGCKTKDGSQRVVSVAEVDQVALSEHGQASSRGYIQKLVEKGHLEIVPAQADLAGDAK